MSPRPFRNSAAGRHGQARLRVFSAPPFPHPGQNPPASRQQLHEHAPQTQEIQRQAADQRRAVSREGEGNVTTVLSHFVNRLSLELKGRARYVGQLRATADFFDINPRFFPHSLAQQNTLP